MAKYESQIKYINAPVERVYSTLSNLENFRPLLENAANNPMVKEQMEKAGQDPAQLEKLKDVQLTNDRVAIPAPMIGEIALAIIEREENKTIKFQTEQSPVEANLWIQVLPTAEGTKMRLTLKADLNPMIKMMIGSKLEDGIDKFADMLAMLPYGMV
ncbi:MAG: SRPBCC family protein [Prevotella sp.]|nr:SRPBCC family protein [Candidatus Prevotella equi]